MADRSSRPHRLYRPTPPAVVARIARLRRQRWTGQRIAGELGLSPATVSRILKRLGLNKLKGPWSRSSRCAASSGRPGELIHIDIQKLGGLSRTGHRITGERKGQSSTHGVRWEFVHVCIDDHSRIAFTRILPDEKKASAVASSRSPSPTIKVSSSPSNAS